MTEGQLAAALLYAGKGAALSHSTAAWRWRLINSLPRPSHVTAPGRHRDQPGLIVHRSPNVDRVFLRDLPVTTPVQTLLDFASQAPPTALRNALANAEYHRLLHLDEVEALLGRGRRGSQALRRALERHRPQLARTISQLERELIYLCETHGIAVHEVNVRGRGLHGRRVVEVRASRRGGGRQARARLAGRAHPRPRA